MMIKITLICSSQFLRVYTADFHQYIQHKINKKCIRNIYITHIFSLLYAKKQNQNKVSNRIYDKNELLIYLFKLLNLIENYCLFTDLIVHTRFATCVCSNKTNQNINTNLQSGNSKISVSRQTSQGTQCEKW